MDENGNEVTDAPRGDAAPATHHPTLREMVVDAAIEAERETGRHEATAEEARQSAGRRLARLIAGWVLVLVGIAGLPLPGPGWLIIILGLSLLPYVWAERTIRIIRQRIPGIPEDGRIPTRTWIIMGVMVAASLAVSIWWGMRDDSSDSEPAQARTAASASASTPAPAVMWQASPENPADEIYGNVIAETTDQKVAYASLAASTNQITGIEAGTIDAALVPAANLIADSGAADPAAARTALAGRKIKAFGPVTLSGVEYWPVVDLRDFSGDDEVLENAIDGVSELINGGATLDGDPAALARTMLDDLGMK